ncbi:hypothetical protein [Jidongwangia harbinensis]|uniref:hypothetical protein n=1 Tax=Jidongwangia harbinensis TaxID=2878561 RepID=UPI001CD9BE5F|nr:hypothetical protein [Jidongwangia harbinensis]MCA2211640.1 hypothetical protein [Jidongwangia harbinensis]
MPEQDSAWSAGDYTRRVIRPHLRNANDVAVSVRYDLESLRADELTSDDVVLQRVADVVAFWHRQLQGTSTPIGPVCRRWVALDGTLREEVGPSYQDASWWRAQVPSLARPPDAGIRPLRRLLAEIVDEEEPGEPAPAPPPFEVKVEISAGGVDLSWTPPPEVRHGTRYLVERSTAGGHRAVITAWLATTRFRDEDPPVAEQVWYSVTAEGSDRTGRQTAWFDPPVTGFDVYCGPPGVVRGAWKQHRDCVGVLVWRTTGRETSGTDDGVPVRTGPGATEFTDDPGLLGKVQYHIVPLYRHRLTGRQVVGRRTSRGVNLRPAPPVPELAGTTVLDSGGRVVVRTRWSPMPAGVRPALLRAWENAPAMAGKVGPDRFLPQLGDEITPSSAGGGTMEYRLPTGLSRLLPVAVADGLACFGAEVEVERVPQLIDLRLNRTGHWVRATWDWPEKVQVAKLVWRSAGREVPVTVTDVQLRDGGGYVEWEDAGPVSLVATAELHLAGRGVLVSEPDTASVRAAPLTLIYAVVRRWWHGPGRRALAFTADRPCAGVTVKVWLHEAGTPPEKDRLLGEYPGVSCGPGRHCTIRVRLPARPEHSAVTWYARCEAWIDGDEVGVDNFNSRREL